MREPATFSFLEQRSDVGEHPMLFEREIDWAVRWKQHERKRSCASCETNCPNAATSRMTRSRMSQSESKSSSRYSVQKLRADSQAAEEQVDKLRIWSREAKERHGERRSQETFSRTEGVSKGTCESADKKRRC